MSALRSRTSDAQMGPDTLSLRVCETCGATDRFFAGDDFADTHFDARQPFTACHGSVVVVRYRKERR